MSHATPPSRPSLHHPALALMAALVLGGGPTHAQPSPAAPRPVLPGVDPRVDTSKITDLDLPSLPEEVVLPLPPDHRVARLAAQVPMDAAAFEAARAAIDRGLSALATMQQDDGRFSGGATAAASDAPERLVPVSVAITALVYRGFMQSSEHAPHPEAAARARAALLAARSPDGTFSGGPLANYVTAVVASALSAADDPEGRRIAGEAVATLSRLQWDEGEGITPRADWYGGAGYGSSGRPDLSNTQMMLEALYDAGVSPDEPAVQRALAFVTRTQNLSATNPADWAGDDGGFAYTPANGGESMASEAAGEGRRGELLPEGTPRRLRSYGSMSYAGFKSLLYAGLSPEDVRVRAVFDWIRRHYTFRENPGLGQQGLYYYLHAAARALRVGQQVHITPVDGEARNWREDLVAAVLERQQPDGSWRNDTGRWLEDDPALATAYAVLALQEAIKPVRFDIEDADESADTPGARIPSQEDRP